MSTSFSSQFGSKLFNPSNSTDVSPADVLKGKDHVSTMQYEYAYNILKQNSTSKVIDSRAFLDISFALFKSEFHPKLVVSPALLPPSAFLYIGDAVLLCPLVSALPSFHSHPH